MSEAPESIYCSTVRVLGVDLVVHVLNDGRRIIEAESMGRFLEAMSDPDAPTMGPEEIAELARAMGR